MRGSVLNHSVNWLFYSEFFIFELWNWKWLVEKLYQQNVVHSMWVLNMLKGSLSNIVWERKNEFFCLLYICSLTMLIPSCRFWGGGGGGFWRWYQEFVWLICVWGSCFVLMVWILFVYYICLQEFPREGLKSNLLLLLLSNCWCAFHLVLSPLPLFLTEILEVKRKEGDTVVLNKCFASTDGVYGCNM